MRRALAIAATEGVPTGPNPRVGCVLIDPSGDVIAEGFHRGAGTAHAEAAALAAAGARARGCTAVVTLEPCNHEGRTGPCAHALVSAGVSRVVFGQVDPNPLAAGGARTLVAAGIEVIGEVLADEAAALNEAWTFSMSRGRPLVTWKMAATLDGRVAARDGTARWITGPQARAEVHRLRGRVDAVVVGTGTVLTDDPSLTSRTPEGRAGPRQPVRVVMGRRPVPATAAVRDGAAPLRVFAEETPEEVLGALAGEDVQHVLLEAGPRLSASFVRAGLVDRVIWYVAPKLLGGGLGAVADLGVDSLSAAVPLHVVAITQVGADLRVDATMGAVDHRL